MDIPYKKNLLHLGENRLIKRNKNKMSEFDVHKFKYLKSRHKLTSG